MSGTSEQIVILYNQGNTPETIASLLELSLADILLILQGAGKLTEKKVKNNLELSKSVVTPEGVQLYEASPEEAKDVFLRYHRISALKICKLAESDDNELVPAAIQLKAAIYVNEENTGRNEARARKEIRGLALDIGQLLIHAAAANSRVANVLGLPQGELKQLTSITEV